MFGFDVDKALKRLDAANETNVSLTKEIKTLNSLLSELTIELKKLNKNQEVRDPVDIGS